MRTPTPTPRQKKTNTRSSTAAISEPLAKRPRLVLDEDPALLDADADPEIVFVGMRRMGPAPFNSPHADLTIRTLTDTTFMVHRSILAAASPVLAAKIASVAKNSTARQDTVVGQDFSELCEIALPESDFVVETLLRFIYPLPDPVLLDLDDLVDVYVAATERYSIAYATAALQRALSSPRFLDQDPVRVYAIAQRFALEELAKDATRSALKHPSDWPNYEEFRNMSADHYHSLLTTHRRIAREAAVCVASPFLFQRARPVMLANMSSRASVCSKSFTCWWEKYVERAKPVLLDTPTSDKVCSPAFVAGLATHIACQSCREALLTTVLPNGYIQLVKEALDALPAQHGL
ncbi:hypothetical protein PYCCODRAFT_1467596 [Trametes coccinea BRFM310]|uniref:BTB domain-containing protein n=1 Tax=Trametes coccinea (strain BRFM310) TaxID=1353009 RepID=A0A1Y2IN49_TRAC3|nr:hypothetical protein PYCCODRAFT_1467596 [Trametes coccinea BRFM310]